MCSYWNAQAPRMAISAHVSLCEIIATVPTGLEHGAADECREILGREAKIQRGRILIELLSVEELTKVDSLRSIENYHVTVKELPEFCRDEPTALQRLETLPSDGILNWDVPLEAWQYYRQHLQVCSCAGTMNEENSAACEPDGIVLKPPASDMQQQNKDGAELESNSQGRTDSAIHEDSGTLKLDSNTAELITSEPNTGVLQLTTESPSSGTSSARTDSVPCPPQQTTFRVTCTRGGRKHTFTSMDAARHFGAGLVRYFGWKVQLKNPDLEVLLGISDDAATVRIALSRESKYKRNITHFGPTTLRSTIAYGMLRLATILPGDVVVDPMCGGGSITIEGSMAWPSTYHLAGDFHELASPRTMANLEALKENARKVKADVLRWDVCALPLKTSSVDVIVTDMPFGKKSGSRVGNWELYPRALEELGRVCRPGTARAVMLTHDTKVLSRVLRGNVLWNRHRTYWINIGGLVAGVYILHRTVTAYQR